ncbi:MAG TPA: EAL domain-containing protein [Burkholderiales bacterium]|nr:EAL domain-containing protein [Burkholderiales bacterium]
MSYAKPAGKRLYLVGSRKKPGSVRQYQSTISQLIETLLTLTLEAESPEAAFQDGLRLVCEHGQWQLGHAIVFAPQSGARIVATTLWESGEPERYGALIAQANSFDHVQGDACPLMGRVLSARQPVWISDLRRVAAGARTRTLIDAGIVAAFALPIVAKGEILAVLEFFATDPRETDTRLLDRVQRLSRCFARIVELQRAAAAQSHILRAEAALKASEARLRAILDNEPACVKVVDAGGRLREMNRAGLEFLQAESIDEIERHGLMNVIAPAHQARFRDLLQRTLAGEKCVLEFEIVGLRGARYWVESNTTPFQPDADGPVMVLAVTRDITAGKRAEDRIAHLAQHDALTGLPNRNLFRDRVDVAVSRARRRNELVGAMVLNLDRFSKVNESLGFDAGDTLLKAVALRLSHSLQDGDTLARLDGDAFGVLLQDTSGVERVTAVAEQLHAVFGRPFKLSGLEVFMNVSLGVGVFPPHAQSAQGLIECAELAMNGVKQDGGGGYRCSEGMHALPTPAQLGIEGALRGALAAGELEVHYQPKVDLKRRVITGAEALLRWTHAELGAVSPATFIPIAEDSGLIVPIGAWVLGEACAQAARWHRSGHAIGVSVNLSPRQFRQNDLVAMVAATLRASGLPAEYLELEITEGTAMATPELAVRVMQELHALGVKLSVDDFGTGYSSLSYLHRFPLDRLKIDRSFVLDMCTQTSSEAIIAATIALAHSLRLEVVAEGVETEMQHAQLTKMGCDQGQGYLYSRAVAPDAFQALLSNCALAEGAGAD